MDLYEILGVRRNASLAEVRRAYQKRARALHPDLNPGDPVAVERFRAVSRAFEILADPQRRSEYDRGEPVAAAVPAGPEVGFEGFDFDAEVRVGAIGFHEIFDGVLSAPAAERGRASAGENLEQSTRVTFQEAFSGARRRIHVVRLDHCPICRGQGHVATGPAPCPRCHGSGRLRARRGHMIFSRRCLDCDATGVLARRPCNRCGAEGRLMQSEWLDVEIPAGVSDGMRLRVPDAGNAGRAGGPAGDFFLVVHVEPHAFYGRAGEDLECVVPISLTEAALGGHVEVPTPDGVVTIEVPAGTQPGQRFRLRKRGMPRLDGKGRGDLHVEVKVVVPPVVGDRARGLLQEVAKLLPGDPRKELAVLLAAPVEAKK
jgi:molecular chaperone DnaJ